MNTLFDNTPTNFTDVTVMDDCNPPTNVNEIPMMENSLIVATNAEPSMLEILPDTSDTSVSYQQVTTACHQLCHVIDGDKELMKSVLCTITQ